MAGRRIPGYLLQGSVSWRTWLDDFPEFDPGGYVPARLFIEKLEAHPNNCPPGTLSRGDIHDLERWFRTIIEPPSRVVRDNKKKNIFGYVGSAVPIAVDFFVTGGAVTWTVTIISGIFFSTTGALDVANSIMQDRIDRANDIFSQWLESKRS